MRHGVIKTTVYLHTLDINVARHLFLRQSLMKSLIATAQKNRKGLLLSSNPLKYGGEERI